VKVREVSFEELQRDKRQDRLRDAARLEAKEVTPRQLEEENSLIPLQARIRILDLPATMERLYGK